MTLYKSKIIDLRKNLGLSQKKFAEMCKISTSAIAQYETGARNPSKKALYTICTTFEVEPDYFALPKDTPLYSAPNVKEKVMLNAEKIIDNQMKQIDMLNEKIETLETQSHEIDSIERTKWDALSYDIMIKSKVTFSPLRRHLVTIKILEANNAELIADRLGMPHDKFFNEFIKIGEEFDISQELPIHKLLDKNSKELLAERRKIFNNIVAFMKGIITSDWYDPIPLIYEYENKKCKIITYNKVDLRNGITDSKIAFFNGES